MTDVLERLASLDPARDDLVAETHRAARAETHRDRLVTMPFDRIPPWRVALGRPRPTIRRLAIIVTALAIAIAGIVLPIRLFDRGDQVVAGTSSDRLLTTIQGTDPSTVAIVDLETGAVTPIGSGRVDETSPVWSPDGSRIAFARDGAASGIVIADPDGKNERILAPGDTSWTSLAWSPDGQTLAVWGTGNDLRRIDVASGEVSRIATPREIFLGGPIAWSPDGSTLAFVATPRDDDFGLAYLYLIGADGENLRRLTVDPVLDLRTPPAWSPDGGTIVYHDASNELAALDIDTGRSVELTAAATDGPGNITGVSTSPTFSPDGARIAFLRNSATGPVDVWVMDADGSNERQITHETDASLASLAWQPRPSAEGEN